MRYTEEQKLIENTDYILKFVKKILEENQELKNEIIKLKNKLKEQ